MCPKGSASGHIPKVVAQPTFSCDRHSQTPLLGLEERGVMVPENHLEQFGWWLVNIIKGLV